MHRPGGAWRLPYSFAASMFRMKWLQYVGLISYGVYMLHQPVRGVLYSLAGKTVPMLRNPLEWGLCITALFATILLASASYFLIEKRFLALGHKAKW